VLQAVSNKAGADVLSESFLLQETEACVVSVSRSANMAVNRSQQVSDELQSSGPVGDRSMRGAVLGIDDILFFMGTIRYLPLYLSSLKPLIIEQRTLLPAFKDPLWSDYARDLVSMTASLCKLLPDVSEAARW
jgi:hypothetical protein